MEDSVTTIIRTYEVNENNKDELEKDTLLYNNIKDIHNDYSKIKEYYENEVYTYDNNMILKKIKFTREEEYSSEERANSQKSIHEGAVDKANEMEGMSGSVETKSNTSFVYSFTYDLEKISNLEDALGSGMSTYLDYSTHKFDADKYADGFENVNNSELSSGTCVIE